MSRPSAAAPHHQLQYLEALGLTFWTARYQLPNARPTDACEWPSDTQDERAAPPAARLQALLRESETAAQARDATPVADSAPAPAVVSTPAVVSAPVRARALLGERAAEAALSVAPAAVEVGGEPQAPLRFSFTAVVVQRRWWVISVGARPDGPQLSLLDALFAAIGVVERPLSAPVEFRWPMIEGLSVEEPLLEARDALRAFVQGRGGEDGAPEWLLLFADESEEAARLRAVLDLDEARSGVLTLPVLSAPSLATLLGSGEEKRRLWPALARLRDALAPC